MTHKLSSFSSECCSNDSLL